MIPPRSVGCTLSALSAFSGGAAFLTNLSRFALAASTFLLGVQSTSASSDSADQELANTIRNDPALGLVAQKAREVVGSGFTAGDKYEEVWIRDFNSFIELACDVHEQEVVREILLVFFRLQGEDGNIVDAYVPKGTEWKPHTTITTDLEPRYIAHKNTVETDQETSLIQATYKYIHRTGDTAFLQERVGDRTVAERMLAAVEFLKKERFADELGLIWGATTADWGDVQPEHPWGVLLTEDSHLAVDIYDNAMLLIALKNLAEMIPEKSAELMAFHAQLSANVMKHLWDDGNQKFIPHVYLDGSPFPDDFDENQIYGHGGTAVAIEAGLLSREQVYAALKRMRANVQASGAASIGLTIYPVYPNGFFKNPSMVEYGYQNGGDWTWFGARMIQQLIRYGYLREAYDEVKPMLDRVVKNDGFYEWYTRENEPMGSGVFRGSAGVLYSVVELFEKHLEE